MPCGVMNAESNGAASLYDCAFHSGGSPLCMLIHFLMSASSKVRAWV